MIMRSKVLNACTPDSGTHLCANTTCTHPIPPVQDTSSHPNRAAGTILSCRVGMFTLLHTRLPCYLCSQVAAAVPRINRNVALITKHLLPFKPSHKTVMASQQYHQQGNTNQRMYKCDHKQQNKDYAQLTAPPETSRFVLHIHISKLADPSSNPWVIQTQHQR